MHPSPPIGRCAIVPKHPTEESFLLITPMIMARLQYLLSARAGDAQVTQEAGECAPSTYSSSSTSSSISNSTGNSGGREDGRCTSSGLEDLIGYMVHYLGDVYLSVWPSVQTVDYLALSY